MFWLLLPALWSGVKYVFTQVALWAAFVHLSPYIAWLIIGIASYWFAKGFYFMMKSILLMLKTKAGQILLAGLLAFGIGGGVGWYLHPSGPKVKVHAVRLQDVRIRSSNGAITHNGVLYYKAALINAFLKAKGQDRFFAPSIAK